MIKRYFIFRVLGWPDGPIIATSVKVPDLGRAFYTDPINGYETEEEAEQVLERQAEAEKIKGEFMIVPLYRRTTREQLES